MRHPEAIRKFAAKKFLLGELSDSERQEFERHLFECSDCAEAVETAMLLVANAKAVFQEEAITVPGTVVPAKRIWFSFSGRGLATAGAMAGCVFLAILASYQNLVQIPTLRANAPSSELRLVPAVFVRAARTQQEIVFSRRDPIINLTVAHEWVEPYLRYEAEIECTSDHVLIAKTEIPGTSADVSVVANLQRAATGSYILGQYGVRDRPAERTAVAHILFTLTEWQG